MPSYTSYSFGELYNQVSDYINSLEQQSAFTRFFTFYRDSKLRILYKLQYLLNLGQNDQLAQLEAHQELDNLYASYNQHTAKRLINHVGRFGDLVQQCHQKFGYDYNNPQNNAGQQNNNVHQTDNVQLSRDQIMNILRRDLNGTSSQFNANIQEYLNENFNNPINVQSQPLSSTLISNSIGQGEYSNAGAYSFINAITSNARRELANDINSDDIQRHLPSSAFPDSSIQTGSLHDVHEEIMRNMPTDNPRDDINNAPNFTDAFAYDPETGENIPVNSRTFGINERVATQTNSTDTINFFWTNNTINFQLVESNTVSNNSNDEDIQQAVTANMNANRDTSQTSIPEPASNTQRLNQAGLDPSSDEINGNYICPLSGTIMTDPVYDPRAPQQKYERSWLNTWLSKHATNPMTRQFLSSDMLVSAQELKNEIDNFVEQLIADDASPKPKC